MASRLKTGPNFEEAKVWTEQQIKMGKLDIQDLQANLIMYGFLAKRTDAQLAAPAPKTLDRETFDALVKFQTAYRDAVQRMDPKDRRGIELKPIIVDGKAGNQTQNMIIGYTGVVELARRGTERRREDMLAFGTKLPEPVPIPVNVDRTEEKRGPLAKAVPVRVEGIGKRIPEQLTEDAAMARMERVINGRWKTCTITGTEIESWEYDPGKKGTYQYTIQLTMTDGKIFELDMISDKSYRTGDLTKPKVMEELRQLALATIRGYGEVGELGERGTVSTTPFALLTSASIIDNRGRVYTQTELYSYDEGATNDLKREKYGEGITYLVRIARELKNYDKG